ncbi:MAG TPA: AMP-binding protein [Burkholderiaceae bacterium]|nr:AMP-binding protein [Burkholderiaceae bacterium]
METSARSALAPMDSVGRAFDEAVSRAADRPFLIVPRDAERGWLPGGARITYRDAANDVATLARRYGAAGAGPGVRIALVAQTRPETVLHFLALNRLGASIVPLGPDATAAELSYLLAHSRAAAVAGPPSARARIREAGFGGPFIDLQSAVDDYPSIDACPGMARSTVARPPLSRPEPAQPITGAAQRTPLPASAADHEAAILYTSGSTGRPKGCVLTNRYFLTAGAAYLGYGGLVAMRIGEERFYNPLPLFHMNHLALTLTCALLGMNALVLTERFSASKWWREIAETGATIIHYLGIVVPTLLKRDEEPAERAHAVRFGLGGGCEPSLRAPFERRFGFPLVEAWGMTETGRLLVMNREPRHGDTRAIGRPYPGLDVRVADASSAAVPAGTPGELLVRHHADDPAAGFFSGYLDDPQATASAWRDGWFHTGDVVTQADDGTVFFVDRSKNIVRRAGENIAAAEIEAALVTHESVLRAAVIAAPDDMREEEVYACVVLREGCEANETTARMLQAWCGRTLAYFKLPGWIQFRDELPVTSTQKIRKYDLFAAGEDPRTAEHVFDLRDAKRRPAAG